MAQICCMMLRYHQAANRTTSVGGSRVQVRRQHDTSADSPSRLLRICSSVSPAGLTGRAKAKGRSMPWHGRGGLAGLEI
jgi:hypothetical protein